MIWLALALLLAYAAMLVRRAASQPRGERVRALRRALAPVALVYLAIMLMLIFLENRLLYHPLTEAQDWETPIGLPIEDVWLTSEDGTRLHGWWFPVSNARWCVLYSHGNAGNLSHRHQFCRSWQQLGASVLIYDYPGYGRSSGRPSEAGCQAAARAAYDWLRDTQNNSRENLLLFGESLGCAMAIELATTRPHSALILYAPFTSIGDMAQSVFPWLPARWLVRTRYNNLEKMRTYCGPLFIAHGTADTIVPFEQGRRLFQAVPAPDGPGNCFFPVPDRSHNDGLTPEVFASIGKFLSDFPSYKFTQLPMPGKS